MNQLNLDVVSKYPEINLRKYPILFVHGAFHGSWAWEEFFLQYFADLGYEVHALNWRGHGNSPGKENLKNNRINDYVDDVSQVVNSLKTLPIMVGHSMGGFVVQKYLENHQIPAGVLLASAPPGGTRKNTFKTAIRNPGKMIQSLKTGLVNLYNTEDGARKAFFSKDMPTDQTKRYVSLLQDESLLAFMDMTRFPVKTEMIKNPMLVLGAENDMILDRFFPRRTCPFFDYA
ncbi:alpha/beta hydrolase [Peribacillus asahii]|uniref:alpha/beta hydrolase n=1 Tax=Peribacillus asahii TaxID=228899 RepID=UPI002079DBEE|nr:alpha/beta fold hydrolase [Peribacillus asahii]USK62200.1 alpha/beta hydrolase [Peribacillus asahii]